MRIVAVCGSPRRGNTEFMLRVFNDAARERGAEARLVLLRETNMELCDGCETCEKGTCHIQDDLAEFYAELKRADIILFGSPTYWANVSGNMKIFFDRLLPFYYSKELKGKKVILMAVGSGSAKEVLDFMETVAELLGLTVIGRISAVAAGPDDLAKNKEVIHQITELARKYVK